jgi:hypothetical protein
MKLTGKTEVLGGKTCLSATGTYPGWNPGLRGERLATNRRSHRHGLQLKFTSPYQNSRDIQTDNVTNRLVLHTD